MPHSFAGSILSFRTWPQTIVHIIARMFAIDDGEAPQLAPRPPARRGDEIKCPIAPLWRCLSLIAVTAAGAPAHCAPRKPL
jgi:hypothetical protein